MSNLLSSLSTSANALEAYAQVLEVTQNNVANTSTPGYARQRLVLHAMPFDPGEGSLGGVRPGELESARNVFADQSVRRESTTLGFAQQNVESLTRLQSVFDIASEAGLPDALNDLFQSFSAWSQDPAGTLPRREVMDRASDLVSSFRKVYAGLAAFEEDTIREIQQTVGRVNDRIGQLQALNVAVLRGNRNDPDLDARIASLLEQLSEDVEFTAVKQDDGTIAVLLNGQTPLLLGDRQYLLSARLNTSDSEAHLYAASPPIAHLYSADGMEITEATSAGRLGALIDLRNRLLPSYIGDATQPGDLNLMAKALASRINELLTPANPDDGTTMGVPLFEYDEADDSNVVQSLRVTEGIGPDQLHAAFPGPPEVANGVPLALSRLAEPLTAADRIAGLSFNQFYGDLAARAGRRLNDATEEAQVGRSLVAQAKDLRQQLSGVSLDEEATLLIQFQRAYEANSRILQILDRLTEEAIHILR